MDLALATPKLDHNALRFDLLLLAQRKSRTKVTLLLLIQKNNPRWRLLSFSWYRKIIQDEGYSPSPDTQNSLCFHGFLQFSSTIFAARALLSPSTTQFFQPFSLQDCVWREFHHPPSGLRAVTDGRFTPIPSLTLEEPPHLPIWREIHSRIRELLWFLSKYKPIQYWLGGS
jgi:hypothetical protein